MIAANYFFELAIAKKLARGIFGFNYAIGVKQETIARMERNLSDGVLRVRFNSNHQAVTFDALQCNEPRFFPSS